MKRVSIIGVLIMWLLQGLTAQLPVWATLNRLDIFAAGTDRAIWHLPWNGQKWGY